MRKFAVSFLISFIFVFSLCARPAVQNTKSTVVIFTDVSGIPDTEKAWLGVSVADKLESNLFAYANMSFINEANKQQILDIQRESEGAAYDENTAFEVGKLASADSILFVTIKKGGSKYSLTVRYTDVTSAKNKAVVNGTGDSAEALYADKGSVVDILTIELCDALNIILTPAEKDILLNGEKYLSSDERNKINEEKIKLFEDQIKNIDKLIENASISGELDAVSYMNQLEAEKKLADENLKIAKENQRRAEMEAKKRREDEARDAKRSAEQKEKIEEMSQELKVKYSTFRNKKLANEPILGQIKVIELKKKALLDIQSKIDNEIDSLNLEANTKINNVLQEITNREISVVEQGASANTLSEAAKANRAREFEAEKEKIVSELKRNVKQINDELIKQNKKFLNDIHKDYNNLRNITVSSLSDDLTVDYGNYDGNKGGWPLYVTVKSDDIVIFQTTSFLPYKELTGKEPIRDDRDPNFKNFALDVDTFESLFLRGEPILTFEVEYTVSPYSPESPSKYRFKYNYLKYYDTRYMSVWGNKLRSSKTGFLDLDFNSISKQLDPVYDISAIERNQTSSIKIEQVAFDTGDNQNKDNNSKKNSYDFSDFSEEDYYNYDYDLEREEARRREEERKRLEKQKKEQEKERKKAEEKKKKDDSDGHPYDHSLFGINAGFGLSGLTGPSLEMELNFALLDCLYWGLSSTSYIPQSASGYEVIPEISYLMVNQAKVGLNLDLYLCNVYSSFGIGFNYFTYIPSLASESVEVPENIPNIFNFSYTFEFGGSFQINRHLALSCGYLMVFSDVDAIRFDNLDFGIVISF